MDPLWEPSADRIAQARLTAFIRHVNGACGLQISGYPALYRFSIERPADFWREVWTFCGIRGDMGKRIVINLESMIDARFFPDARLNFADNVLRRRDNGPAVIFNGEGQRAATLTHAELYSAVARFAAALRRAGVRAARTPGLQTAGPSLPSRRSGSRRPRPAARSTSDRQ